MKTSSLVPERILTIGLAGSGKSESWVATATQLRKSQSEAKVRVLNCDTPGMVERCNERYPDWTSNVEWEDVGDWAALVAASDLYRKMSQPGDFIVIDGLDKAWVFVRDLFLDEKARKSGKVPDPTDFFGTLDVEITGGEYGDKINPAYNRWLLPLLDWGQCPAHIIACTPSQPIVVEGMFADSKSLQAEFSRFGVRPTGQKMAAFQFQTVLWMQHQRQGYVMTSMKDRSRELVVDQVVKNWPIDYLVSVAGWEP